MASRGAGRDADGQCFCCTASRKPPAECRRSAWPRSARAGWNVAALDLRGYGRSGGTFASFGGREAGDVRVWLDALAAQAGQARPLLPVLWGRSMGAAIAVRAAAADARIQALILESPMVDLDLAMAAWFRNRRFPCARLLARLVTRRAANWRASR